MAKKEPDTVIVAIHGGKPEDYSEISDQEFEDLSLGTFGTYHLTPVSFPVYCEWMYNVKKGNIEIGTAIPTGDGGSDGETLEYTFWRDNFSYGLSDDFPPPFHYIDPAQTWQGVSQQIRLATVPPWGHKDSDGHEIYLRVFWNRAFFHRGHFYFLLDNQYEHFFGPKEAEVVYVASKEKLEVIATGISGPGEGYVYRQTWIKTDTYFPS